MKQDVTGNTTGLKASQIKALERIYRRRIDQTEVISAELAAFMCEISAELHRQIGVLVDRRGAIAHVMVGDASKIMLPDVGRMRGGMGRFRGLRLVHTHLRGEKLTRDDLTDLALLRLDVVAAITVAPGGRPGPMYIGHLLPDNPKGDMWRELPSESVYEPETDFAALMDALEAEFQRKRQLASTENQHRALLVHVALGREEDTEARIAELRELCRTAGVDALDILTQRRPSADPRYLVGRGKLEQILLRAMQLGAESVIFNQDLTPGQARAITNFTELKILDRTMLILDIFAQHAVSRDGKLQVELAQLKYALPRLAEKNTMMSRLTGGIGGRGPGETKLEINRRRARDRIRFLENKLEGLAKNRRLRRQRRESRDVPIVAIVGYTNAGKSTLLNALTEGNAKAENKLFATLDPISRRLRFPQEREVVLTDTVGFIRDLPPDLVTAFRATLEELEDADLLVHVVDLSDPDYEQHVRAVTQILSDLELGEKPRLLGFNKCDRLDAEEAGRLAESHDAYAFSALDHQTFNELLRAIERELWREGHAAMAQPPSPDDYTSLPADSP
ncbi:GTPase HflX [Haliangium ochraceum]|uniref:GTPase HflX n=1 Tax=Haliangium ochraceum (strain DSM 14365 / JCM 11303 / SMP-2) TaxID=502025 RepID=D0LYG2_HALO1|nr:GTPase HflX [Haliangium ochraceum]ACY17828.1 GTP-binding proten HflX [Haliangium ochraceum DSM 14365]